jgi:hypothetical protein
LPNLDLKLGIVPKAGNFLSGKREGEGRERETEIDGRDREIEGRDIETEKQRDRAGNKNPKQSWVAQLVSDKESQFTFLSEN